MKIAATDALQQLARSGNVFAEVYQHGTLSVEIYQPDKVDHQKPHDRDEAYVVVSGSGTFFCNGDRTSFVAGDFLFVPAFVEHRFENFTPDFSTWVIFYGPKGGEHA
jgi:mannose-6-phosphate isomerase-like protein (cupin superfamily)